MDKAFSSGFTLIELLAVIVILALVSLIAIPMIMNVIETSRKGAYTESLRNLIKAIEYYEASEEILGNNIDFEEGLSVFDSHIEMKNKNFIAGKIKKNEDGELYLDMVSDGVYCGMGTIDKLNVTKGSCGELDTTVPSDIVITENKVTGNAITIAVSVITGHSGVKYYEYSIDGGSTYISSTNDSYTFTGLKKDTDYQIKVRVTSGNHLTGESEIIAIRTLDIEVPSYSMTPNTTEWVQKRMVTIIYPERGEGYIYEYSLDKGNTWVVLENGNQKELEFIENGTIIGRIQDGTNVITGETFVVSNVDSGIPTMPTITGGSETLVASRTISVSEASTSASGIKNYQYYISTSSTGQVGGSWVNLASGVTNVSITTEGTRYIYFRAVNNVGTLGTISTAQTTNITHDMNVLMNHESAGKNGSINTDTLGNKRYAGSDPNNYVCFGIIGDVCDANHLYRIIGVIDGKMKIIKNDYYSTSIAFDTTASNNWSRPATLNTELNGNAFYGNTSYIDATHKSYIINATWYIGGIEWTIGVNYLSKFEGIERERSMTAYIGLMSVVDFGYASNDANCNKSNTDLSTTNNACMSNNWLFDRNYYQWTITPRGEESNVWILRDSAYVGTNSASRLYGARPSMFLDPSLKIKLGEGTKEIPYILTK